MIMRFRHVLAIVSVVAAATLSAAYPMMLLTSPQVKCMSVEAPADALLNIQYEAPDLIMPSDLEKDAAHIDPRSLRRFRTTLTISQSVEREPSWGAECKQAKVRQTCATGEDCQGFR